MNFNMNLDKDMQVKAGIPSRFPYFQEGYLFLYPFECKAPY